MDWNADGSKIVSGHKDGKVRIWSTDRRLLDSINGQSDKSPLMIIPLVFVNNFFL